MAAMESRSSWPPQANSQPPPPMAHAPKPIGVISRSEFPSCFVFMVSPSLLPKEAPCAMPHGFELKVPLGVRIVAIRGRSEWAVGVIRVWAVGVIGGGAVIVRHGRVIGPGGGVELPGGLVAPCRAVAAAIPAAGRVALPGVPAAGVVPGLSLRRAGGANGQRARRN